MNMWGSFLEGQPLKLPLFHVSLMDDIKISTAELPDAVRAWLEEQPAVAVSIERIGPDRVLVRPLPDIEPELLARWLPDAVGSEVLTAEPPRLLQYRWRTAADDRDSYVTFELTGTEGGGTHLRVDHRQTATILAFRKPSRTLAPRALLRWAA